MKRARLAAIALAAIAIALVRAHDARANAPPGQYTIDAAGTVTDNRTGLVWQQTAVPPRRTVADATTYCQGLAIGALTTGWRLPQIRELLTIIDPSQTTPPLWDQSAFGTSGPGQIWSQTPDVSGSNGEVWGIDLTLAESASYVPTTTQGVLCVHD